MRERPRVRLEFEGEPVEVLGWMLLAILSGVLIVPLPWFLAALCRWVCENLIFSDGARAEFHGRGGEVAGWVLLSCAGIGIPWLPIPRLNMFPWLLLGAVFWLLGIYGQLRVIRWCVTRAVVGAGEQFRFDGTFRELLGWFFLNGMAAITIIGWAWTTAEMYRWAASSTHSERRALKFHGEGFDILWRSLATVLFSLAIVTIPWAVLWYSRWLVSKVTIGGYYARDDD